MLCMHAKMCAEMLVILDSVYGFLKFFLKGEWEYVSGNLKYL